MLAGVFRRAPAPLQHIIQSLRAARNLLDLFYKELRCPSLDAALAFEEK